MWRVIGYLKSALIGGALVVLPAWLAVLLFIKALVHLEVLVKPVSAGLPESVRYPMVIGSLLIVLVCLLVGVVISTAIGRQVRRGFERIVLERLPGYSTLRSVAEQLGQIENSRGFQPALVEIEDALAPCFIVEEHADGRRTVFVPSSPTPAAGTIYIIAGSRVHPLDIPVTKALKCITKWGAGSGELLAAMQTRK